MFFGSVAKARRPTLPLRLRTISLREFGGGWNAIDNDLSLNTRYSKLLKNLRVGIDNSTIIRFGNRFLGDVSGVVSGNILDGVYFNGRSLVVTSEGEIATRDTSGTIEAVWNSAIAAALPSAPAGWSSGLMTVDFVPSKNRMLIHNGIDKPLEVGADFSVRYLADPATDSNVFTPIGKYGTLVADYHVIAGIPADPTVLYISSKGTDAVFPGDDPPNDSISFDVGLLAPQDSEEIRGIGSFQRFLLVFFRGATLVLELGVYDEGSHVPAHSDTLQKFGILSHRVIADIENELLFADVIGTNTAKRQIFTGAVESERLSTIISPEYQKTMALLTDEQMQLATFSVYDRLGKQWLIFEPGGRVFVFSFDAQLRRKAWSEYEYPQPWTAAFNTYLGRVIVTKGTKLYQLGNDSYPGEGYAADYLDDRDASWATSTLYEVDDLIYVASAGLIYRCFVQHTSDVFQDDLALGYWIEYSGTPIDFDWELPWVGGQERLRTKNIKYIGLDTEGSARFALKVWVDGLYKDAEGTVIYDPALEMEFVGGQSGGFGWDGEQPFGAGRRTLDMRLWRYPLKFKRAKFRLTGSTDRPLKFINLSALYALGSYKR